MVFQVENTGKSRARKFALRPRSIFILSVHQICHCFGNRRIAPVGSGKKTDQTPSRLRSGAVPIPLRRGQFIRSQRLAESSVGLLHAAQPRHSPLAVVLRRQRNRLECAQYSARPVNVVRAPPAEPRAVFGLVFRQELYRAPNRRMVGGPAETPETFHDARRHVCG